MPASGEMTPEAMFRSNTPSTPESESERVRESEREREKARARVCVCVGERERERESQRERERERDREGGHIIQDAVDLARIPDARFRGNDTRSNVQGEYLMVGCPLVEEIE